ncbi:MAG: putative pre6S rRNA nuclease [Candidatus Dependentiae bacterium]|nr:putative pre6S rRNA nuclease [Candidatus Dependentiae bacterium]
MRILALDLGDVWVGTAISDPLGIVCRPLKTVKRKELVDFLKKALSEHDVSMVLVGLPAGARGEETEQSKKTRTFFVACQEQFPLVTWELLDEYLTSQLATSHQQTVKRQKLSSQSKLESHSLAAAFLLKDYLYSRRSAEEEDDRIID